MIRRIDHIDLHVRDVQEFVDMFKKLGFQVVKQSSHWGGAVELQLPGAEQPVFEVHKVPPLHNPGVNHIAFLVDDIEKECQELAAKGIVVQQSPYLNKTSGRTLASFRNPDGFRLQLVDSKRVEPVEE